MKIVLKHHLLLLLLLAFNLRLAGKFDAITILNKLWLLSELIHPQSLCNKEGVYRCASVLVARLAILRKCFRSKEKDLQYYSHSFPRPLLTEGNDNIKLEMQIFSEGS